MPGEHYCTTHISTLPSLAQHTRLLVHAALHLSLPRAVDITLDSSEENKALAEFIFYITLRSSVPPHCLEKIILVNRYIVGHIILEWRYLAAPSVVLLFG